MKKDAENSFVSSLEDALENQAELSSGEDAEETLCDTKANNNTDEHVPQKDNKVKNFVKQHKSEIVIVASGILFGIATGLAVNNWDVIREAVSNSGLLTPKLSADLAEPATTALIDWGKSASSDGLVTETVSDFTETITRASPQGPFSVCEHLRTLPEGWHASADKIAYAAERGISLESNQTIVSTYMKGLSAAG